ncbi:MAG TPA: VOC family protein [Acidimicrobiia bacterium]|nr:VOC family protein [Acidimicrobiia bacterium]
MLAIDHVIFVVEDLDHAAAELFDGYGLASVAGGRHAGHGTGNRIVPLGSAYLELMAVLDPVEAADSPLGRWAASTERPGLVPAALCLRTEDADREAERLGLAAVSMSRIRPDGTVLSWRLVGVDEMFGPDRLPFFIEWEIDPDDHPGRMEATHQVEPAGVGAIVVTGDPGLIRERLGEHALPIEATAGEPGIASVTVATTRGDIVL